VFADGFVGTAGEELRSGFDRGALQRRVEE